jgi:glycosyltransferase involved in cell wall biosynthesis
VSLLVNAASSWNYSSQTVFQLPCEWARRELDHDLEHDDRIHFIAERLSREQMLRHYRAADAYVSPARGEGWGRPFMEAMACGKPVIGANWSGNAAFMTPDNSYLIDYDLVDVPLSHGENCRFEHRL